MMNILILMIGLNLGALLVYLIDLHYDAKQFDSTVEDTIDMIEVLTQSIENANKQFADQHFEEL